MSFAICLTLIVASLPFMSACTKPAASVESEWLEAQVWTEVPACTTSTVMTIALASLVTKESAIRIAIQPRASTTECLSQLINGASCLSMTTTYDLYHAYRGLDAFHSKEKGLV